MLDYFCAKPLNSRAKKIQRQEQPPQFCIDAYVDQRKHSERTTRAGRELNREPGAPEFRLPG